MTASLRISHVITTGSFAGTERYAVEVGTELARRGHRVQIIGGEPVAMQRLIAAPVRWSAGATPRAAFEALIRSGRRDIVHSHITKSDFVAFLAGPVTGGARISTRHITARRGYSPLAARLAHVVKRGLRRELAVSAFVAAAVETRVDAVLINGVRPVDGHEPRPREKIVLVAQRLAAEKHTGVALDAWVESGLSSQGWRLVVAGDGPLRGEVEARIAALGADANIEFLGWVDDLAPWLQRAGILLAPAPAEPCGLTLLEAMAYGLPVVAPGSGGNPETLGRDPDAALFTPGDVPAAARQLVRLASDDRAREAYGDSLCKLQRSELSLEHHVDQLEALYHDALR